MWNLCLLFTKKLGKKLGNCFLNVEGTKIEQSNLFIIIYSPETSTLKYFDNILVQNSCPFFSRNFYPEKCLLV